MIELQARAGEKDAGRKIKYFVRGDMQVSYGQFSALKTTGGLMVNGETVHANHLLRPGDLVTVRLNDSGASKAVAPEDGPVSIVYEDDDIYIIDKPAPLACQCTPRQPCGTLENRLFARYACVDGFVFRPLNRLDKGTSGLMCVAKHAHAFQLLQKQLHGDSFIREYEAIVDGEISGDGVIELPIAKEDAATVRRIIDHNNGVFARTFYRVIDTNGKRSLVRLKLDTGRTHQIRVHMSALGHPVTGDFLYGREIDELPGRFALHSVYISLLHPLTGKRIECHSPLPSELKGLIRND